MPALSRASCRLACLVSSRPNQPLNRLPSLLSPATTKLAALHFPLVARAVVRALDPEAHPVAPLLPLQLVPPVLALPALLVLLVLLPPAHWSRLAVPSASRSLLVAWLWVSLLPSWVLSWLFSRRWSVRSRSFIISHSFSLKGKGGRPLAVV